MQPVANTFVVVGIISEAVWFDYNSGSGTYQARFALPDMLTHNTSTNEFVYVDRLGRQFVFYDFSVTAALQGQFVSFTDPYGQTTAAVYNANNQIISFTQQESGSSSSSSSGVPAPITVYEYTYLSSGNNAGRLQSVTLLRGTIGLRRTHSVYCDNGDSFGSLGDLRSVTLQQFNGVGWDTLGTTYHRYYKSGDAKGFAQGLKYLVSPASYEKMLNAGVVPETASDAVLATYADLYFEYDSSQRVTLATQANTYTWTFSYTASGNSNLYNSWITKTVETLPDGSQNYVYTNYAGQVMLKVFVSGSSKWYQYYLYGEASPNAAIQGRTLQFAESSAVASYSESSPGLVTLNSSVGLIHVYDYYTSTTATTTTAGGVAGYIEDEKVKQGSGGSAISVRAWQYIAAEDLNGNMVYPLASDSLYQSDSGGGSNPAITAYSYQWYYGTLQMQVRTTTLPVISSGQNGDGNTYTRQEYFDVYGRVTWRQDELDYLTRIQYDDPSGAVLETIEDVDTSLPGNTNPMGWTTPAQRGLTPAGGLNLVTDNTIDSQGRVTQSLGPLHAVSLGGSNVTIRRASWTVYQDVMGQVWNGSGYWTQSTGNYTLINPVRIVAVDGSGRATDQITAVRAWTSGALAATDSFPQTGWVRWMHNDYGPGGILLYQQVYFLIPASGPGIKGTNYNETDYLYDPMKRQVRMQSPGGTITWQVYSPQGDLLQIWIGTNDTGATLSNPGGSGAPNNMVEVTGNVYDSGAAGGDRNLTSTIQYVDGSTSRTTTYGYDFRNRQTAIDGEVDFYQANSYDNQDRLTQVDRRNTSSSGNLIARSQTFFDYLGRTYQTVVFAVDPSTGTVGNSLTSNNYYDGVGNLIERQTAGSSAFTKSFYDGVRRSVLQYTGYTITSPAGDVVMEQTEVTYDAASNIVEQDVADRFHDAPSTGTGSTGLLTNPSGANPKGRVSYTAYYPDPLGRTVAVANYGTNGGVALSRPAVIPSSSATILVTSTDYNNRGEADLITNPAGMVTEFIFDHAGRLTTRVEDYSTSSGHLNKETDYSYNPDSQIATQTARNSTTGDQVTTYTYGTNATTSDIVSNQILATITYPDSTGGSDQVTFAYNRQGQIKTQSDQMGTVHTILYDLLGRQIHDCVTTLGSGVDGTVRRVSFTYEVRGMLVNATSYSSATVGSGTVVNDVQHAYNTFAQLVTQYQSHSGAVVVGTTPSVQYGYANGSANTVRPTSITYPNARVLNFNYGTSGAMNDQLSRIGSLIDNDGTTHLVDYTYVGQNYIVQASSPQPGTELTYIKQGSEPYGDGGDQYTGWDRFSRVIDQRWIVTATTTALERIQYGFDQANNRLYRANLVAEGLSAAQDEYYGYDNLNELLSSQRGTLNTGRTGISGTPTREEDFTLDPTGNWNTYLQKVSGVTTLNQGRTHNKVNELTKINGVTTYIGQNAAGNITTAPQTANWLAANTMVYDAWNRLISVTASSGGGSSSGSPVTLGTYRYDGLNRRVTDTTSSVRHYYYTAAWQIIEERVGSSTTADRQFVWGLRYTDDLVLRDNGATRFYALHDYLNCTAIIDTTGTVQERYGYNAYGLVRFMTASFGSRSASLYTWETLYGAYRYDAESGYYQVRNRFLHPTLGRWLSRDPIGYEAGTNLYAYAENAPINSLDPLGLQRLQFLPVIPLFGNWSAPPGFGTGNYATSDTSAYTTVTIWNGTLKSAPGGTCNTPFVTNGGQDAGQVIVNLIADPGTYCVKIDASVTLSGKGHRGKAHATITDTTGKIWFDQSVLNAVASYPKTTITVKVTVQSGSAFVLTYQPQIAFSPDKTDAENKGTASVLLQQNSITKS